MRPPLPTDNVVEWNQQAIRTMREIASLMDSLDMDAGMAQILKNRFSQTGLSPDKYPCAELITQSCEDAFPGEMVGMPESGPSVMATEISHSFRKVLDGKPLEKPSSLIGAMADALEAVMKTAEPDLARLRENAGVGPNYPISEVHDDGDIGLEWKHAYSWLCELDPAVLYFQATGP